MIFWRRNWQPTPVFLPGNSHGQMSLAAIVPECMISCFIHVQLLVTLWLYPARVLCPWDSPGKNTGVCCHFLLQGIFPTQESNLGLLPCRQTLYQLSYEGSPHISDNTGYLSFSLTYSTKHNTLWVHPCCYKW